MWSSVDRELVGIPPRAPLPPTRCSSSTLHRREARPQFFMWGVVLFSDSRSEVSHEEEGLRGTESVRFPFAHVSRLKDTNYRTKCVSPSYRFMTIFYFCCFHFRCRPIYQLTKDLPTNDNNHRSVCLKQQLCWTSCSILNL